MRQLRRWKRLWRRSLTLSHKRTSMGLSRSCWNGTSVLQPEITSKGTRVSWVYYQSKCPYEKSLETHLMILIFQTIHFSISTQFQCQKTVLDQTIQFSASTQFSSIWPYQVLWVRVDLGVMAINGYTAFPKAPALLEPSDSWESYTGYSLDVVLPLCSDAFCIIHRPRRLSMNRCDILRVNLNLKYTFPESGVLTPRPPNNPEKI